MLQDIAFLLSITGIISGSLAIIFDALIFVTTAIIFVRFILKLKHIFKYSNSNLIKVQ